MRTSGPWARVARRRIIGTLFTVSLLAGPGIAPVRIMAAFCQGNQVLGVTRTESVVSGPTDQRFRRLLWRTASTLFPDDYEETYGFGILPRWLDFGFGGSVGD